VQLVVQLRSVFAEYGLSRSGVWSGKFLMIRPAQKECVERKSHNARECHSAQLGVPDVPGCSGCVASRT
jgi:hypothetical protein